MAEFTVEDRSSIRSFLDRVWDQDEPTAKAALTEALTLLAVGNRKAAFKFMESVIRGQGA